MPWYLNKDNQRIWFAQMPTNRIVGDVHFCAGDYAMLEENNKLQCITEADYRAMTKDMEKLDW